MTSGDLISYSNFSNTYSGQLLLDEKNVMSSSEYTAYVSSPSWYAEVRLIKNSSASVRFTIKAAYWNGSTWVDAWSDVRSLGMFDSGTRTYKYYHNSTLGSTSGDVASAVLWEIHLAYAVPQNRIILEAYAGSIGCMPEDTYNNLYKGRPIYSCGGPVSSSIYGLEGGRARDKALSVFSQSADRGTLITASNERKLVAYKYN